MFTSNTFHSRYKVGQKIGSGTFGAVYECRNNINGKQGALKKVYIINEIQFLKRLLREIILLKYLKYEHLIQLKDGYMGYDKTGPYIIFVTERMHMNLGDLIYSSKVVFTKEHIKYHLYQIFLALAYLHINKILHRDIKPDNILVNANNDIRVADFGWARHLSSEQKLTKIIYNIHYRAPEICLRNTTHNSKVDIWAVGCLFYEMIMKQILFPELSDLKILSLIFHKFGTLNPNEISFIEREDARNWVSKLPHIQKKRPSDYLDSFDDEDGRDLLDQCLRVDPEHRISAFDALMHPYFKNINDQTEMMKGMQNHSDKIDFSFENNPNLEPAEIMGRINQELSQLPPWT